MEKGGEVRLDIKRVSSVIEGRGYYWINKLEMNDLATLREKQANISKNKGHRQKKVWVPESQSQQVV